MSAEAARPSASGPRRAAFAIATLVALIVAAGYLHALSYPFQFDDFASIRDNAALNRPGDLAGLWHQRASRFVVELSFALNAASAGRSPAGFRAVNLAIHLLASLWVGLIAAMLASRLTPRGRDARAPSPRWIGAIAACLFAAHPLATQAVTYVVQRATSLAALFELIAIACYLRARLRGGGAWWVCAWGAALLAALSKEMSVALPLALVMIEWALRRYEDPERPLRPFRSAALIPFFLIWPIVAFAARVPSAEFGVPPGGLRETEHITRLAYFLTQLTVIPRYLTLALWPRGQSLDHDARLHATPDAAVIAGLLVLIGATLAARLARRRFPLVWIGWLWFGITMLPESSVFPITDVMFEHRAYLPLAGLTWAAAAVLAWPTASRRWSRAIPLAIIVALTAATHARNEVWRDEVSLWSDVVAKAPRKARGFNNLGLALESSGRAGAAAAAYRRAAALDSNYAEPLLNLARLHGMRGDYRGALPLQLRAGALAPEAADVLNDLGMTYWGLGDTTLAAASFTRAIETAGRAIESSPRAATVIPVARLAAMNLARLREGRALGPQRPVAAP